MPTWEHKLGEAVALAAEVHKTQTDKAGVAYILHPLAVMQRATDYYMARSDGWQLELVQIVAVFHDVLEDIEPEQGWSRARLSDRIWTEYGNTAWSAVDCLTKFEDRNAETYDEYIQRVAGNWISRIVKIADLSHNLDAFRLPSGKIDERDFKRWDKYHRALVTLAQQDTPNGR